MKSLFVSALLLLTCHICSAQSNYFEYNDKKDIGSFLKKYVRPSPVIMENCLMPFTYLKFKVTSENTIDSISTTNTSIPQIKDELTRVLLLTNGHWNIELTKDKWLIIPLLFHTEYNNNVRGKGCDFKKILSDQGKEMNYKIDEASSIYFPIVKIYSEWR